MGDASKYFNLTILSQTAFSDFGLPALLLSGTFVSLFSIIISPFFSPFVILFKPTNFLFGFSHFFGVLQGLLLIRFSQGIAKDNPADNDVVMLFLGILVMTGSVINFVTDFIRVNRNVKSVIYSRVIVTILLCLISAGLIIFPLNQMYDVIGLGIIACFILRLVYHLLLSVVGMCKSDNKILPLAYNIINGIFCAFLIGTIICVNDGEYQEFIELFIALILGVLIELTNIIINICTKNSVKQKEDISPFGRNVLLMKDSECTVS